MKQQKLSIWIALIGIFLSLLGEREGFAKINLCPSTKNQLATNQSIKLQYLVMSGIIIPDVAGELATDWLEIEHNANYPIPGLQHKGLVPNPNAQVDSCVGNPNSGGQGYNNGACDGKLVIRVYLDGMTIPSGVVTVNFLEIKSTVPQSAVTFLFQNWPDCGDGTTVPCSAIAPFVSQYAPIMDVVSGTRKWNNLDYFARIDLTQFNGLEMSTNPNVTSVPDEYLHLAVNPGPALANSQWFAFAVLDDGSQPPCVQVSRVLPLKHN